MEFLDADLRIRMVPAHNGLVFFFSPRNREILMTYVSDRFLEELGLPKGLLGTIQSIWVAGNLLISNLETIPPQNHVFPPPIFGPKPSPAQISKSQVQFLGPGPKMGLQGPKPKICGPKNHAEFRARIWKWRHMVQVMAKNRFEVDILAKLRSSPR